MGKGESGMVSCCWLDRKERNQAVSRTALVMFSSLFLLLATIETKVAADLASEKQVLLEMKSFWGNPLQLISWSNDTSPCDGWLEVQCDNRNTTVTYLKVPFALNSTIPTIIGNLTNLTTLDLSSCSLNGRIPRTIGSLKRLQFLILGSNGLTGSIPAEIGDLTNLESLDVSQNYLNGTLPDLSRLKSLRFLKLGPNNELTGPLPSWVGGLSALEGLNLLFTNFTGSIPPEIGNLTKLGELHLESCGLSGLLPPELGNLKSLYRMLLDSNTFTGSIPDSFRNLQNLTELILNDNNLNGSLGSWVGNLRSLSEINLDANFIEGPIPLELGGLSNLTRISLNNNDFTGEIPASFGNLRNLLFLDLSNNFLTGPVPSNILSLPNLTYLAVDNNCLNGSTPVNQSNSSVELVYEGNCFNDSQSEPCKCVAALGPSPDLPSVLSGGGSSNSNSKIYISVGVVVGSLLAVAILILIYLRCRRPQEKLPPPGSVRVYKLSEIKEATKDFTTRLGKGGQATVYKAEFKDGKLAAVKRFGHDIEPRRRKHALKTFDQEVGLLARLNHRYLVNVIGYCEEAGEYMLLFDYMDKGSLYDHLHGVHTSQSSFTWEERVTTVICVACGIDYLHYGCSPPVFHRDIKSANILLSSEQKLVAKVADFGLGKLTTIDPEGSNEDFTAGAPKAEQTQVMGSHGYMDPDFLTTTVYSEKSDIYSYGVVLLELITGRKALDKGKFFLTEWVRPYLEEPRELLKIVDPKLEGNYIEEELLAVAEIARNCIDFQPSNRPTIRSILQRLRTVFKKQTTTMISASQRTTSSGVEFSGIESNFSGEMMPNNSINSCTQSEILPRD